MEEYEEFHKIIGKIEELKKEIVNKYDIDYYGQDARMVALDNIQLDFATSGMWINTYYSLSERCINENEFLNSINSRLSLSKTYEYMFKQLKFGLITAILFKMDNLFSNIISDWHFDKKEVKSYYKKSECIINKTILTKEQKETHDTLTILANIRNSLHNNGIHITRSLKAKINNIEYVFETGKRVECASWGMILNALSGNIDVLTKILLSDKVDWKHKIKDDFSSGK